MNGVTEALVSDLIAELRTANLIGWTLLLDRKIRTHPLPTSTADAANLVDLIEEHVAINRLIAQRLDRT